MRQGESAVKKPATFRFLSAAFVAVLLGSSPTATACRAAELTPQQRQRNLESFEFVWQTIRDKHWDPKLGGLDWQAVHDEFRPLVEKAESMAECREILTRMIRKLGQSHFQIIPKRSYEDLESTEGPQAASTGVPGFDVRVVDGEVLVTDVAEELSAAKPGVKPGWPVVKVGGQEL